MGPRARTRFLTKLLVRICCCILLLVSFSQLPFDRRVFAWKLSWLLFPDASLVLKFSYVAFQCLGTYHRFSGVPKCSLHFWRFRFLNAFLCFHLFSSRPFFLLVPFFSVFLSFFVDTSGPKGHYPLPDGAAHENLLLHSTAGFFLLFICSSPPPSQLP